jgi:DNA-directed RNA polymerase beta subunit
MASLNLKDDVANSLKGRIDCGEELLGKGIMMPFNNTNSGSRKLMYAVHLEQRLPLMHPEVPLVGTGYEDQFGKYSSSFVKNKVRSRVIAKIPKFSFNPKHHYYLILESDPDENGIRELRLIERVNYKHVSESYGYLINNDEIDMLKIDDIVEKDEVIQKSTSFDKYNNRMDGVNLITTYLATEHTMEDGIIISDYAAKYKLASPLFKVVRIVINDNDIPLNLRGGQNGEDIEYKCLPNIGEYFSDGILYAQRREKKEDSLYTQAKSRLSQIMISDEKFTVPDGTVIDIDLHVNNVEKITTSKYYSQLNMYYQEQLRVAHEIVQLLEPYKRKKNFIFDYELQKLYFKAEALVNGKQYMADKVFSNIVMDVVVMQVIPMAEGDKMSNRYGGKGVVSLVLPQHMMPQLPNGDYVDCIMNKDTVTNRQNFGQLFEMSLNHIGPQIVKFITLESLDVPESIDILLRYIRMVSPKMAEGVSKYIDGLNDEDVVFYLSSISKDMGIYLSIDPMSESMTIDKLEKIYDEFPFLESYHPMVPIEGSKGTVRYVQSRRPMIIAYQYFYRLKQYAEEKFSVTSLSATNIRNENSRNKANNMYKAFFARTPVKFGDMETGDLIHAGAYIVAYMMMIYSTSPHGRRLTESMLTGDPFHIDIRLDEDSRNRSAEIVNVYFKAIGLRLKFTKRPKQLRIPIMFEAIDFSANKLDQSYHPEQKAIHFFEPEEVKGKNYTEVEVPRELVQPIYFQAIDFLDNHPGITAKDLLEVNPEVEEIHHE